MSLPNSSVHRCAPKGVHVHPEQVVAKGLSGCRLWVDQPAIELVKKSPRIPGQACEEIAEGLQLLCPLVPADAGTQALPQSRSVDLAKAGFPRLRE